jgi:catechol 2,3-dioxygenase-like lactoylglutathione lyase family enzyme
MINHLVCALLMLQVQNPFSIQAGGNMLLQSANLERSLEFYRDFIGLPDVGPTRTFTALTAGLADLYVAPGAEYRPKTLMVPGSDLRVELIEFRNVDANPVHPKLQDPGATLITFNVRDVDAVAARAEKNGVQMITPGGKSVTLEGGKARAIFVKDPSGFYVEVVQRNEPIPANAPPGNVIGARLAITVKDTDETLRFYRDMFGFDPQSGAFIADKTFTDAAGVPATAQYRKSTALMPSTNLYMDFYEYRGVDRTPMKAVIHDPGIAIMRLMVKDINASVKGARALGMLIVNWSGEPTMEAGFWFFMGRDPNYFFFEVQQRSDITPLPR